MLESFDSNRVWFIRVLFNQVERQYYFDIRRWERIENETMVDYVADNNCGITLPLKEYFKLFEVFLKLSNKWKEQVRKQEEKNAR